MKKIVLICSFFLSAMSATSSASAQTEVNTLTDIQQRCKDRIANFGDNLKVKTYFQYTTWGQIHAEDESSKPGKTNAYAELSVTSFTNKESLKDMNIHECGQSSTAERINFQVYVRPQLKDLPEAATAGIEFLFRAGVVLTGTDSSSPVSVSDVDFSSCKAQMMTVLHGYFFEQGFLPGGQLPRSKIFENSEVKTAIQNSAQTYCDALENEIKIAISNQYVY